MSKHPVSPISLKRVLPYVLIIAGLLGCLASFALTYDKIHVLQNPDYNPSCNINPILSCGSVMKTEQASLFGVPNTIFGLMSFSALVTLGFVLLAGARLQKWIWLAAQVVATMGVVFMHYLFFQGIYRINAICPWCSLVWMITIPVFWYITLYNVELFESRLSRRIQHIAMFMRKNHGNILLTWYLILLVLILERFWYYWSSLL